MGVEEKKKRFGDIDRFLDELRINLEISCRVHKCQVENLQPFSLETAFENALASCLKDKGVKISGNFHRVVSG